MAVHVCDFAAFISNVKHIATLCNNLKDRSYLTQKLQQHQPLNDPQVDNIVTIQNVLWHDYWQVF